MSNISNLVKERLNEIPSSMIRRVNEKYSRIDGIIKLTVGEPDFDTPDHIKLAAIKSILNNRSHYAPNRGTSALRTSISDYLYRRFELRYAPESQIIVTNGATEAISTAINGIVRENDVVLIPSPAFSLYETLTLQNGGQPVAINTEPTGFKLTPNLLQSYLDKYVDRVKLVVLNYPNNPTGVTYTHAEVQGLVDVLKQYQVAILSDEVYSELSFDVDHLSIAKLLPDQVLYVNSVSKSYAMTGWRIGYLCGPESTMTLLAKVHQANVATIGTINMDAATEAFLNGDGDAQRMNQIYEERQHYLTGELERLGFTYIQPQGAFYIYTKVPDAYLGRANAYTDLLAEKAHVATVPGEAFGTDHANYFRISYATSWALLKEAISRIEKLVNEMPITEK